MTALNHSSNQHNTLAEAARTWKHASALEELDSFLVGKPPVRAVRIELTLVYEIPGSCEPACYVVPLSGTTLSDHILDSLNLAYEAPSDIEGVIWFEDGSWARHHQGQWIYHTSSAPRLH